MDQGSKEIKHHVKSRLGEVHARLQNIYETVASIARELDTKVDAIVGVMPEPPDVPESCGTPACGESEGVCGDLARSCGDIESVCYKIAVTVEKRL